jgi:hypothetical protein
MGLMKQSSSGVPDQRGARSHGPKTLFELIESGEFPDREHVSQAAGTQPIAYNTSIFG